MCVCVCVCVPLYFFFIKNIFAVIYCTRLKSTLISSRVELIECAFVDLGHKEDTSTSMPQGGGLLFYILPSAP
jgi:hypothetical protein